MNRNKSYQHNADMNCLLHQIARVGSLLNVPSHYKLIMQYQYHYEKTYNNNGNNYCLKLYKYYYDYVKALCLNMESPDLPDFQWIKVNKGTGHPVRIHKLIEGLNLNDNNHKRFILTLFSLYESGTVDRPVADLKSLTEAQTNNWPIGLQEQFISFLNKERFVTKLSKKPQVKVIKDYVSLKGGPLGPATPSWTKDLLALTLSSNSNERDAIIKMEKKLTVSGSSDLESILSFLPNADHNNLNQIVKTDVKLPLMSTVGIPDKGPKTRTITKGNYFMQRALKPLHIWLMDILRLIPEDGTYKQDAAARRVQRWTDHGKQPYCYDLTAATDRMPMWIQLSVLKHLNMVCIGQWKTIMKSSRSFNENTGNYFSFTVGQPMGLFSSWPSFTITHHYIIRFAFYLNGTSPKDGYSIIGDDVSIIDPSVAETYKGLILGLGINISRTKSVTPETVMEGTSAEMAKRLFVDGIEISPIRPRDLLSLRMETDGWINLKDFALEISRRWDRVISWKMVYAKSLATVGEAPVAPILTFVKPSQRKLAHASLSSPYGGPRIHLFAPKKGVESDGSLIPLHDTIEMVPSIWSEYDNTRIKFAKELVVDEQLEAILQNISDVKLTLSILNQLDSGDSTYSQYGNYNEFHRVMWYRLDINPFYQAIKGLESELETLSGNPFTFNYCPAVEVMQSIKQLSVQIDLVSDWLKGKIKRDVSDLKYKKRKANADLVKAILKHCKESEHTAGNFITYRHLPEASSSLQELRFHELAQGNATIRLM